MSGVFLEHPFDLADLLLEPLGGDGAGGLHLGGEDGDPVLLHHPSVFFQLLPPLSGGGGNPVSHFDQFVGEGADVGGLGRVLVEVGDPPFGTDHEGLQIPWDIVQSLLIIKIDESFREQAVDIRPEVGNELLGGPVAPAGGFQPPEGLAGFSPRPEHRDDVLQEFLRLGKEGLSRRLRVCVEGILCPHVPFQEGADDFPVECLLDRLHAPAGAGGNVELLREGEALLQKGHILFQGDFVQGGDPLTVRGGRLLTFAEEAEGDAPLFSSRQCGECRSFPLQRDLCGEVVEIPRRDPLPFPSLPRRLQGRRIFSWRDFYAELIDVADGAYLLSLFVHDGETHPQVVGEAFRGPGRGRNADAVSLVDETRQGGDQGSADIFFHTGKNGLHRLRNGDQLPAILLGEALEEMGYLLFQEGGDLPVGTFQVSRGVV